ncbi:sulfite exporter TauE/SafE family protein [Variovorax ginsengisoli]|uniref:Probable membrane transporter protein n=1 Tax=Variovorax ginsengisoli TaxID=363844 RepID=A0ABT9SAY2_9BURK|nr:sulfite exporter TauE/SafE family protein [Variovorax ginsengisoli]MDP9901512.1 putative membrane protein YfcA [Variovorax ginsengisoli]
MPSLQLIVLASAVFLLAGIIKGVVGLGLPTLSMALLALWMPPVEAAALLILPSFVTNVWQLRPWSALGPVLRRVAGLQVGIALGTLGGAWFFGAPAGAAGARTLLGAALLGYAVWGLAGRSFGAFMLGPQRARWLGPCAGLCTGVVTALTGVFVVPAVPYLHALGLQRDAFVQAMGVSFTTATVALAAGLAGTGNYQAADVPLSLVLLLPALAGMALGQRLRERLPLAVFRRCFFGGLGLLGAYLMLGLGP